MADLKPVYVISGADRPKIGRALQRLRAHFEDESLEHLHASETTGADAVAACNALGLFADVSGRLVVVEGVDGRRTQEGRMTGGWKDADVDEIAGYLREPVPGTVLALVGEQIRRDSSLAKACAKKGDLLLFDVDRRRLPHWVAEQFASTGAQAYPEACRALIDLVGDDLFELAGEIEKLAVWAGPGRAIDEADVARVVAARAESPSWTLTDAWGARDLPALLSEAEIAIEREGATPVSLVFRLAGHVELVHRCRHLDDEGVPAAEAAKRLRRKEFPVKKAYGHARAYSADELDDALVTLAELDGDVKGGSRLPAGLLLDRALIRITKKH